MSRCPTFYNCECSIEPEERKQHQTFSRSQIRIVRIHLQGCKSRYIVDQHLYVYMLMGMNIPQVREQQQQQDFNFHQDGLHPALIVRELIDKDFLNRQIGLRGAVDWLPRSPDLTLMDVFFWGCLKYRDFARKLCSIDATVQFILLGFQEIFFLVECMGVYVCV